MAALGNVTIDVTMDKKKLAQDLRATAAFLDPEGAQSAESKVELQRQVTLNQEAYDKVSARRDKAQERVCELEAELDLELRLSGNLHAEVVAVKERVAELRHKLDREVAASRANAKMANDEMGRRIEAERALRRMAESFMDLHNIAKTWAPKTIAKDVIWVSLDGTLRIADLKAVVESDEE